MVNMRSRTVRSTHSRELSCSYLYSDGTLIQMFDERKNGLKIGESADVTLGYAKVKIWPSYDDASRGYQKNVTGRIVLHRYHTEGIVKLCKGATVEAISPSINAGSENSRSLGIAVGYFKVKTAKYGELSWTVLGSVISSEFTIQPDGEGLTESNIRVGGDFGYNCRIVKVTDLRKPVVVEV